MTIDVDLDEVFPQPVAQVWRAITDPATLAEWLMENDFEPLLGKKFTLRCEPDVIACEVLEIDPPRRMVWEWTHVGAHRSGKTTVTFELRAEGSGTRLTLRHTGDMKDDLARRLRGGWPGKLDALRSALGPSSHQGETP